MSGVKNVDGDNKEVRLGMLKGTVSVYNPKGANVSYWIELGAERHPDQTLSAGHTDKFDCGAGREVHIRNRGPGKLQVLNAGLT
ncbi:hypothetical protein [Ramlibacter humi]|uniref:Uncharacterized protein n=1 Tax=Ramlibacter humi TaxID=2530451 RepID=A0A4Z0CCL4_9BURK|nr:hypothetical protein [Ramlibacter humi]TFZ07975.1 hypothetical protein EZ216_02070 [Ramlibacter humi]